MATLSSLKNTREAPSKDIVLLYSQNLSAGGSVQQDGIFTSDFNIYKFVANFTITNSAADRAFGFRFRSGSTSLSGTNYTYEGKLDTGSGGGTSLAEVSATYANVGYGFNGSVYMEFYVTNPRRAARKAILAHCSIAPDAATTQTNRYEGVAAYSTIDTNLDGFDIFGFGQSFSGPLQVYGYRS